MSERITVRLTKPEKAMMNFLVSQGKYKDISSFVRQAVRALLQIENVSEGDVHE